jgi:2,3-bisphosphoglycerate-independent phosphoglycerate mutase
MDSIKPLTLVILDGWGIAPAHAGNAITLAETPNFDRFWSVYPRTQLEASGEAVGLPPGEDGNSETGHLNLGAGRIVYQDLPRINMSIAEGTFFKIPAFLEAVEHVKKHQSCLHLMGLISDAGVHSSLSHLFALLRFAKDQSLTKVFLHLFTDGRDSPPTSSLTYINNVEKNIKDIGLGQIATLIGRYYAMDRDHRWERTQKAYDLLTLGKGEKVSSIGEAINRSYTQNKTDEFIEPLVIVDKSGRLHGLVSDNDAVIFFNFRIDRPRQLTKAFIMPDFEKLKFKKIGFDPYAERYGVKAFEAPRETTTFKREKVIQNLFFVTMTEYEKKIPAKIAFRPVLVKIPLGRVLAENGLRQLHIAETEKFPHVTYFFNGGREEEFPGEDHVLVSSPHVATYDLKPSMSAYEVTKEVLKRIKSRTYKFILINYANPDMVGHTGVVKAAIKACEVVDECLGKVVNSALALDGRVIITADHGNTEEMLNLKTGEVDTEHSTNPVPLIIVDKEFNRGGHALPRGILGDVAPTVLSLMGIRAPSDFTGRNLLKVY